jgi:hypothetical protein
MKAAKSLSASLFITACSTGYHYFGSSVDTTFGDDLETLRGSHSCLALHFATWRNYIDQRAYPLSDLQMQYEMFRKSHHLISTAVVPNKKLLRRHLFLI